jgi:hypothetical protein
MLSRAVGGLIEPAVVRLDDANRTHQNIVSIARAKLGDGTITRQEFQSVLRSEEGHFRDEHLQRRRAISGADREGSCGRSEEGHFRDGLEPSRSFHTSRRHPRFLHWAQYFKTKRQSDAQMIKPSSDLQIALGFVGEMRGELNSKFADRLDFISETLKKYEKTHTTTHGGGRQQDGLRDVVADIERRHRHSSGKLDTRQRAAEHGGRACYCSRP